jgi:hypothetical protein
MNDVADVWTTLEPTTAQRRRIDARVDAWLESRDTSMAAEWLGLFKAEPVSAIGLLTASAVAVSLAAATPAIWVARALL